MRARWSETVFVPTLESDDIRAANADMVVAGVTSVVGERRFELEVEHGMAGLDVGDAGSGCDGVDAEPLGLEPACEFVAGKEFGDGAVEAPHPGAGLGELGPEFEGEFVAGFDG